MKQLISGVLIFAVYLGLIAPLPIKAQAIRGKTKQTNMNQIQTNGLQFRLSEGVEGAETREVQPQGTADALSEGDTSNLLKRIPPIKEQTDDKTDFAKRAGTLPPPKTGKQIPVKFPSDEQRGTPKVNTNGQTLEVIRFSPEGEIPLAPDLSVTFSQPMVAVTSQEEAAQIVPVQLTPQPEGKWRWLGTKTLMFDTTKRFPMATKFTARIPAGTKSANGQVLQKDVVWTFTTPPPKIETMIPNNQITGRDALMFISFDQAINPQAVLETITVTGAGRKLSIRLATQEEIEKDANISYYTKQAQPNRWLVFRAVNSDGSTENALPADSTISVTVEKGTPSAEGPLTTIKAQSFNFKTYGAMKFVGGWCNYQNSKICSPFDMWFMQFSNPIEATSFTKEMVKIEPPIEGLNIYPSGNHIYLQGIKKGRTTYKVTVDNSLKDTFGQTLGNPAAATFKVGSAEANLYSQGGSFIVLDPMAKPAYSVYSTNQQTVKVKIYAVTPQNWEAFRLYMRNQYVDEQKRPKIPGRLVVDKVQQIQNKPDEMVETRIDLSEALNGGFGNAIIEIEPTVKRDQYDRTKITVWAQATQIGLDAFVDNQELVGFATELKTGKPLTDVELSIYPNGKKVESREKRVESESTVSSLWNWLTSWGTADNEIKKTEFVESNGVTSHTDTIEEATANRTTENGILRLPLPEQQAKTPNILIARKGKDVAFLPEQSDYYWQDYGNWYRKSESDSSRWFVFDDRKMYRPKEEVSVKGYIRKIEGGKLGDVGGIEDTTSKITYQLVDEQGNEITKGEANLNAFGAFD
ncbi:MAG: Ig-like domain-containing protein, partial [Pyrinomonadaceae bacterium]